MSSLLSSIPKNLRLIGKVPFEEAGKMYDYLMQIVVADLSFYFEGTNMFIYGYVDSEYADSIMSDYYLKNVTNSSLTMNNGKLTTTSGSYEEVYHQTKHFYFPRVPRSILEQVVARYESARLDNSYIVVPKDVKREEIEKIIEQIYFNI